MAEGDSSMGTPFMGEIRVFSFNFAPQGWAMCNGQLLPINQNQALFSLFGTTYGGNGQTNFALPNLQGQVPMHLGGGLTQGQAGGEYAHTLSMSEMPQHIHLAQGANADGNNPAPTGNLLAAFSTGYRVASSLVTLHAGTIGNIGGSQPHENKSPYLVLNFCVSLQGIFPSQT
jgi:microcystin-dependent protein